MTRVCGTGTGNFPKPGDPNLTTILRAVPAFGGIDVLWDYPDNLPHAVAHTILYRSTNADPATRIRHRTVTGDFYHDRLVTTVGITYYYWIQMVSVNGTVGELIGPASAAARPTIEDMIEIISGQIDRSWLGQYLNERIDAIDLNREAILAEEQARLQQGEDMDYIFQQVVATTDNALAVMQEEVVARTNADSAIINAVESYQASVDDSFAALEIEKGAWVVDENGESRDVGVKFAVKTTVDVDGKLVIGGFGVYNDGNTVLAGFDVDTFFVGRTDIQGRKPFIVTNGEVLINKLAVKDLILSQLRSEDGSLMFEPAIYTNGVVTTPAKLKAAHIAADLITFETLKANDGSLVVSNGMLNASRVKADWANISNIEVTTGQIKNLAVETIKIAERAVTLPDHFWISHYITGGSASSTVEVARQAYVSPHAGTHVVFVSVDIKFTFDSYNGTSIPVGAKVSVYHGGSLIGSVFMNAGEEGNGTHSKKVTANIVVSGSTSQDFYATVYHYSGGQSGSGNLGILGTVFAFMSVR